MAVRHGDYKLVVSRVDGTNKAPSLYNLKADVGESKDLAAAEPDRVKELKGLWDKWNAEQKDPLWKPNPAKKMNNPKKKNDFDID